MTEKISQNTNLLKKQWRALTYDWDILATYGNESKLYCLTDFQAAWLLSNTDYMAWANRWSNCPCTEDDMYAMKAELEYNLMNCFDTRWMGQLEYVYQRAAEEQLEGFQIAYDADGIPGINEDTPTDYYNGDDSYNRQLALCMACDTYVRSYLNNWLQQAALLIGLVSILGIFVSSTPFIGLIACVIIGGLAFITQTAIDAVNDAEAVNDVICCMFNGLYGQLVNEAHFQDSLDGCTFESGTNAGIVRDIIASDLNQSKNWFTFLNALGDSWILLEAGVDYTCDCVPEPPTWAYESQFTVDQDGWQAYVGSLGNPAATYLSPLYWNYNSVQVIPGGYWRSCGIEYNFDSPAHVDHISMIFALTKGSYGTPSQNAIAIQARIGGVTGTLVAEVTTIFSTATNGDPKTMSLTVNADIDYIYLFVRSSNQASASYSGSCRIYSCNVDGQGDNPFD